MDIQSAIQSVIDKKHLNNDEMFFIVADSVPENEWKETMNKGRAIFRAVTMAEKGLN